MSAPKYIGTFFGGFICAALLVWLVILPNEDRAQFDDGYRNGELRGQMDVVDAVQKEFGFYSGHGASKTLFEVHTTDLISFETNGVKTISVIQ